MSTKESVIFEGQAPRNSYAVPADGYDGFHWNSIGAVGKTYIQHNLTGLGYDTILAGKVMGYTYQQADNNTNSSFSSDGTFTLKSGTFSSLVTDGVEVTFTAIKGGRPSRAPL